MRVTVAMMHDFARDLEGRVNCMYLDAAEPLGLVTTGLGNLIDPIDLALHLPWINQDAGRPATQSEVIANWNAVKAMQPNKLKGLPLRSSSDLILDDAALDELVLQRLQNNHAIMLRRWPSLESWPLDAELFVHSWAWAVGANAAYPRMTRCLRARNFAGAAEEATINPQVGTIKVRNQRNQVLLANAQIVETDCSAGGCTQHYDQLYWPSDLRTFKPERA